MSPSYTRDYPLVAKRGHGAIVEDVDGKLLSRFRGGHRRLFDRTLPSESGLPRFRSKRPN